MLKSSSSASSSSASGNSTPPSVEPDLLEGIRALKTRINGIRCRIYLPHSSNISQQSLCNLPVCIFLHGGGWIIPLTRGYHRFADFLAKDTQTVVILVDYRLAPEDPFPAGLEDCLTITRLILNSQFDPTIFSPYTVDVRKVILAGDGAGGNLACAVALDLIRSYDYRLSALLLICPILQAVTTKLPSYKQWSHRQPVGLDWTLPRYAGLAHPTRSQIRAIRDESYMEAEDRIKLKRKMASAASLRTYNETQFAGHVIDYQVPKTPALCEMSARELAELKTVAALVKNKRAWPLLAEDEELRHLPRTMIQISGCDPLRSENMIFTDRLRSIGTISVEVSFLENAEHSESLYARSQLAIAASIEGYQQLVDFLNAHKLAKDELLGITFRSSSSCSSSQ